MKFAILPVLAVMALTSASFAQPANQGQSNTGTQNAPQQGQNQPNAAQQPAGAQNRAGQQPNQAAQRQAAGAAPCRIVWHRSNPSGAPQGNLGNVTVTGNMGGQPAPFEVSGQCPSGIRIEAR